MKTIITAIALSVATAGCSGSPAAPSVVISSTPSAPSPLPCPLTPPQPGGGGPAHGLISGYYKGDIPFVTVSCGGPPSHTTALDLKQDASNITGYWDILPSADGRVTGTFDPLAGDPGTFGRVTLALKAPDFEAHIEANVTTADGSTFAGQVGSCGDITCMTFHTDYPRYPVTFVRTGP